MEISKKYQENIEMMFGDIGKEWLKTIPEKIDKYINKFNLKNIKLLNELTYNVLIFGESDTFGPVVLKIEIPFKELTIRETSALQLNNGKGACKCYYSNIEDGVLLIERLLPGNNLNSIENIEERIQIFETVSSKFNIKVNTNNELPTYKDILNRSINMSYEQPEKFSCVKELLSIASIMYEELQKNNESNYLLHSDLYCDNILQSANEWKAIDPHGFIGEKIIDTAIFMQKELEKKEFNNEDIDSLISLMSKYINLDTNDLIKALFVNYVLNLCWSIEVNTDKNYILKNIDKANIILENINPKRQVKTKILKK